MPGRESLCHPYCNTKRGNCPKLYAGTVPTESLFRKKFIKSDISCVEFFIRRRNIDFFAVFHIDAGYDSIAVVVGIVVFTVRNFDEKGEYFAVNVDALYFLIIYFIAVVKIGRASCREKV